MKDNHVIPMLRQMPFLVKIAANRLFPLRNHSIHSVLGAIVLAACFGVMNVPNALAQGEDGAPVTVNDVGGSTPVAGNWGNPGEPGDPGNTGYSNPNTPDPAESDRDAFPGEDGGNGELGENGGNGGTLTINVTGVTNFTSSSQKKSVVVTNFGLSRQKVGL